MHYMCTSYLYLYTIRTASLLTMIGIGTHSPISVVVAGFCGIWTVDRNHMIIGTKSMAMSVRIGE